MPGLLSIDDKDTKINALQDIYNSIIVNDILSRYLINDVVLFKRLGYYLMNTIGQTFSKSSITNYLKNENRKTTRNTISNFTEYLQEALFCQKVRRQDIIGKKILKTGEKYYLTDSGFHHALVDNNRSLSKIVMKLLTPNIIYYPIM